MNQIDAALRSVRFQGVDFVCKMVVCHKETGETFFEHPVHIRRLDYEFGPFGTVASMPTFEGCFIPAPVTKKTPVELLKVAAKKRKFRGGLPKVEIKVTLHRWEPDFSDGEPAPDSEFCGVCGRDDDRYHRE